MFHFNIINYLFLFFVITLFILLLVYKIRTKYRANRYLKRLQRIKKDAEDTMTILETHCILCCTKLYNTDYIIRYDCKHRYHKKCLYKLNEISHCFYCEKTEITKQVYDQHSTNNTIENAWFYEFLARCYNTFYNNTVETAIECDFIIFEDNEYKIRQYNYNSKGNTRKLIAYWTF